MNQYVLNNISGRETFTIKAITGSAKANLTVDALKNSIYWKICKIEFGINAQLHLGALYPNELSI